MDEPICSYCLIELNSRNHTLSDDDICDDCQSELWEEENQSMYRGYWSDRL